MNPIEIGDGERITTPGFYRMSATSYHLDPCPAPSLSSSVAKILLDQSPLHAWCAHPRLNPEYEHNDDPTRLKEIGTAAHKLILEQGAEIAVIDFDDYRKGDAKAAREAARIEGHAAILRSDLKLAETMADRFITQLGALGNQIVESWSDGQSEVVMAWQEKDGFWCRAMVDRLWIGPSAIAYDIKTTGASADPYSTARRVFDLGYDFQAMFYRRGLQALIPDILGVRSILLSQEQDSPHALCAVELGYEATQSAEKEVWKALALWRTCMANDFWPSYPPVIATADLPPYVERARTEREMNDALIGSLDLSPFAPAGKPARGRDVKSMSVLEAG